jgi:hypothetical protein
MELVPGEKWITVKCHPPACCRDIFVVSVPVEMALNELIMRALQCKLPRPRLAFVYDAVV